MDDQVTKHMGSTVKNLSSVVKIYDHHKWILSTNIKIEPYKAYEVVICELAASFELPGGTLSLRENF
jgi:hypothetical protein